MKQRVDGTLLLLRVDISGDCEMSVSVTAGECRHGHFAIAKYGQIRKEG